MLHVHVVERAWSTSYRRKLNTLAKFTAEELRSGVFEPPFGGLRGKVDALSIPRWKARDRLPIGLSDK